MLTDPVVASPRQAAETLSDLTRLRRSTRRSLGVPWFPMVCFGGLTILSVPLLLVAGTAALAPFWVVVGAAGMLLTRRHYRCRARQRGVTGRRRRSWTVAVVMFAGGLAAGVGAGVTSGAAAGVLAPIVVVVTGYAALGWLRRDPVPTLALAPGAGVAATFALAGLAPWVVELTFGAGLVMAGLGLRAWVARP